MHTGGSGKEGFSGRACGNVKQRFSKRHANPADGMPVAARERGARRAMPHTPCPLVQPLPRLVPTPTSRPAEGAGRTVQAAVQEDVSRAGELRRLANPHHPAVGEPPLHADVDLCCCAVPRTADAPHLPPPRVPGCKFPGTGRSLRGRALLRLGLLLPVLPEKRTASPRSMLLAPGRPQCRIHPGCGRSGPAWRQLQQEGGRQGCHSLSETHLFVM